MSELLDRLNGPLHALLAVAGVWLVATSPWLVLFGGIPAEPGFINLAHVVIGLGVLPVALVYAFACIRGGRWRLYFPWLAGDAAQLGRDLAGLLRGERPMSEGGGLFAVIEGLLLLALGAAAITGAVWFALQGADAAIAWWDWHRCAARAFAGLLVLHVLAVALHLVELLRN